MLTLSAFVEDEKLRLAAFERYWIKKNHENPKHFPLQMEDGNDGLWFEMLQVFRLEDETP